MKHHRTYQNKKMVRKLRLIVFMHCYLILMESLGVTGYDCGVFTFLFMALHSQDVPMTFTQDDIYTCWGGRGMRMRLAYLLWKNNSLEF